MSSHQAQPVLRDLSQIITVHRRDVGILSDQLPAVAAEAIERRRRRGRYPLECDRLRHGIQQLQRHLSEAEVRDEEMETGVNERRVHGALGITFHRNNADIRQAIFEWWTTAAT
jgi:Arc/MetJ-type ribon-helix-helix transcriptional regulator